MARHNNISRSLIIMSKQQGWDPTVIEGFGPFAGNLYPENRVTQGDTPYLAGPLPGSPQDACPNPSPPGPDTRTPEAVGRRNNPMAGK